MDYISKLLYKILHDKLKEYLEPLQATKANIDIIENIQENKLFLKNISLIKDKIFIEDDDYPIYLKNAFCESLSIQLPLQSKSCSINIKTLNMLMIIKSDDYDQKKNTITEQGKLRYIRITENIIKQNIYKLTKVEKEYKTSLIWKFLQNIEVQISNLHIRLEQENQFFSIGLMIAEIKIQERSIEKSKQTSKVNNDKELSQSYDFKISKFSIYADYQIDNKFHLLSKEQILENMQKFVPNDNLMIINPLELRGLFSIKLKPYTRSLSGIGIVLNINEIYSKFSVRFLKDTINVINIVQKLQTINKIIQNKKLTSKIGKKQADQIESLYQLYMQAKNHKKSQYETNNPNLDNNKTLALQDIKITIEDIKCALSPEDYETFLKDLESLPLEILLNGIKKVSLKNSPVSNSFAYIQSDCNFLTRHLNIKKNDNEYKEIQASLTSISSPLLKIDKSFKSNKSTNIDFDVNIDVKFERLQFQLADADYQNNLSNQLIGSLDIANVMLKLTKVKENDPNAVTLNKNNTIANCNITNDKANNSENTNNSTIFSETDNINGSLNILEILLSIETFNLQNLNIQYIKRYFDKNIESNANNQKITKESTYQIHYNHLKFEYCQHKNSIANYFPLLKLNFYIQDLSSLELSSLSSSSKHINDPNQTHSVDILLINQFFFNVYGIGNHNTQTLEFNELIIQSTNIKLGHVNKLRYLIRESISLLDFCNDNDQSLIETPTISYSQLENENNKVFKFDITQDFKININIKSCYIMYAYDNNEGFGILFDDIKLNNNSTNSFSNKIIKTKNDNDLNNDDFTHRCKFPDINDNPQFNSNANPNDTTNTNHKQNFILNIINSRVVFKDSNDNIEPISNNITFELFIDYYRDLNIIKVHSNISQLKLVISQKILNGLWYYVRHFINKIYMLIYHYMLHGKELDVDIIINRQIIIITRKFELNKDDNFYPNPNTSTNNNIPTNKDEILIMPLLYFDLNNINISFIQNKLQFIIHTMHGNAFMQEQNNIIKESNFLNNIQASKYHSFPSDYLQSLLQVNLYPSTTLLENDSPICLLSNDGFRARYSSLASSNTPNLGNSEKKYESVSIWDLIITVQQEPIERSQENKLNLLGKFKMEGCTFILSSDITLVILNILNAALKEKGKNIVRNDFNMRWKISLKNMKFLLQVRTGMVQHRSKIIGLKCSFKYLSGEAHDIYANISKSIIKSKVHLENEYRQLDIKALEIFITNAYELRRYQTLRKKLNRKTILQKTDINILFMNIKNQTIFHISFKELQIQNSLIDYILIHQTIEFEKNQMNMLKIKFELNNISTKLNFKNIFIINFEPFSTKIIMLNDTKDDIIPFYFIMSEFSNFSIQTSEMGTSFDIKLSIGLYFYNHKVKFWESVLEESDFTISQRLSQYNQDVRPVICIFNDVDSSTSINMNISETLVVELYRSMQEISTILMNDENNLDKTWLLDSQKRISTMFVHEFETNDIDFEHHISPYTIMNLTGYKIIIYTNEFCKTSINNNSTQIFKIAENYNLLESYTRYANIKLFYKDKLIGIVPHLNIDSLKNEKYIITAHDNTSDYSSVGNYSANYYNNDLIKNNNDLNYIIYSAQRTRYRRILKLMSPIFVENDSNEEFKVKLITSDNTIIYENKVAIGLKTGLPVCNIDLNISIQFTDIKDTELFKIELEKMLSLKQVTKSITSNPNILVRINKYKDMPVYQIKLEHALTIKNCLFSSIQIQLTMIEKINSTEEDEVILAESIIDPNNVYITKPYHWESQIVYLSVRIYGYHWSRKVIMWNNEDINALVNQTKTLTLQNTKDSRTLSLKLLYADINRLYIHAETALVDYTGFGFKIMSRIDKSNNYGIMPEYEEDKDEILTKSQWIWSSINDEFKLMKGNYKSQNFSVNLLGHFLLSIKGDQPCFPMDVNVEIKNLVIDQELGIKINVVYMSPAYVILNQTGLNLAIKQQINSKDILLLKPSKSLGIQWENAKEKGFYISLLLPDSSLSLWTGKILVRDSIEISFPIRNSNKSIIQVIYMYTKKINLITYCVLEKVIDSTKNEFQENATRNGLIIRNDLNIDLLVYQSCLKDDGYDFELQQGKSCIFGWDQPDKLLTISLKSKEPGYKFPTEFKFDTNTETAYTCTTTSQQYFLETEVYHKDSKKILRFFGVSTKEKKNTIIDEKGGNIFSVLFQITKLNVSYVLDIPGKREELFLISMDSFRVQYMLHQLENALNIKIKSIDIYNNLTKIDDIEHVILTPLNPNDLNQDNQNFLEISLIIDKTSLSDDVKTLKFVRFISKPWRLRLDGIMLEYFMNSINKISRKTSNIHGNIYDINLSKPTDTDALIKYIEQSSLYKKIKSLPSSYKNLVIKICIIDPVKLQVTYHSMKKKKSHQHEISYYDDEIKIQSLHKIEYALSKTNNMDFEIKGFKIKNLYSDYESVLQILSYKYFSEIFGNLIIDKSDIKNNTELIKSFCTEYKEFTEKNKYQILKQSDIQIHLNISASILKNTPLPHNTIKDALYGLSSVVTSLAMDDEMTKSRERFKRNSAKNIFQGLGQGLERFFKQTTRGFTGLFSKPIKGVKEKGIEGLAKGIAKGAAGFFAAPLGGFIDLWSKTIEGLANTPQTIFEKRPKERRMRRPRPFYTINQQIKEYDEFHAKILEELRHINENLYRHMKLYGLHEIGYDYEEAGEKIFIISGDWILLYIQGQNINSNKISWSIPAKEYKDLIDLPPEIFDLLNGKENNNLFSQLTHERIDQIIEELANLKKDIITDSQ